MLRQIIKTIEKYPEYALAYASITEFYTLLSTGFDILPAKDVMPKAREAAQKILKLDPNLAEAYVSLGLVSELEEHSKKGYVSSF
jgi:hypothetical protein